MRADGWIEDFFFDGGVSFQLRNACFTIFFRACALSDFSN